jgi:hypothetical protein
MEESPLLTTPGLSRRGLFKSGLIVGLGATGLGAALTGLTAGVADASQNATISLYADYSGNKNTEVQTQWAYCDQCRNTWYTGEGGSGLCAYGNFNPSNPDNIYHAAGSTDYGVIINNPGFSASPPAGYYAYLQSPWLYCAQCACLFWGNGLSESWCPYGGDLSKQVPHTDSGSGTYYMPNGENDGGAVWVATSAATMQMGWKYCDLCKCLYWGNALEESYCQWQIQNGAGNSGSTGYAHANGGTVYYLAMMD